MKMNNKIALEEHFATEEFLEDVKPYFIREGTWEINRDTIVDITGKRLEIMDAAGIEMTILSLSSPAIQGFRKLDDAISAARRINDYLYNVIRDHRDRFAAFAAVPTQDAQAAIDELTRCVKEYDFKGALINGWCMPEGEDEPVYLDDERYLPFWAAVEELGVPIYLHPRPTSKEVANFEFKNHYWMQNAAWGWHMQTGTHVLRLIGSGLFDKYPKLKLVIGHMGEGLPYMLWRTNNRVATHKRDCKAEKPIPYYFNNNIWITTSAHCSTPALTCAMMEMSSDRIMFSTDYPYDTMEQSAEWFDNIPFSETDKEKMGRLNAKNLFNL